MSKLFNRLIELSLEYFNEYTVEQLNKLYDKLDKSIDYSSDELITIMQEYSDLHNLRQL